MAFTERVCEAGEVIFNQDDEPDNFYVVKSGFCDGNKKVDENNNEEFVHQVGSFFGELAMLNDGDLRSASIRAGDKGCVLLQLTKEDFDKLLGPLQQILERNAAEY